MRRRARASLAAACLAALALPVTAAAAPSAQVFIDNGELNYIGYLSSEANQRALALFESAQVKPAILSIRSKGGPTDAGIELGRWVHARGLTVKVMEYCFSSCANYVFPAAPRKLVSNFAVGHCLRPGIQSVRWSRAGALPVRIAARVGEHTAQEA